MQGGSWRERAGGKDPEGGTSIDERREQGWRQGMRGQNGRKPGSWMEEGSWRDGAS